MTVRYSPIAPITILEALFDHDLLNDYLLLLAHDVVLHPARYEQLVFDLRAWYGEDSTFIIMDNGVIELGEPAPVHQIIEAANIVDASCVVAPDMVGSASGTKKLVMDHGNLLCREYPMMLVPQGETLAEICACADWLSEAYPANGTPRYWGVPRWIANKLKTRAGILNYLNTYHSPCKIHLLGMSSNREDDLESLKAPHVMGIDSANPLVLGLNNIEMGRIPTHHMERGEYWLATNLTRLMRDNVRWMHDVVSDS